MVGSKDDIAQYLALFLTQQINENTRISLSSAQKIKFHTWLTSNSFKFNENLLVNSFTISELIESGDKFTSSLNSKVTAIGHTELKLDNKETKIGIDIQSVSEFYSSEFPTDPKSDPYFQKIFTIREISYAQARGNTLQTLIGIFCAKEAIIKCDGGDFNKIEINHDPNGKPTHPLYTISISHSVDYVIAIAYRCNDHNSSTNSYLVDLNYGNAERSKNFLVLKSLRLFDVLLLILIAINFIVIIYFVNFYKF